MDSKVVLSESLFLKTRNVDVGISMFSLWISDLVRMGVINYSPFSDPFEKDLWKGKRLGRRGLSPKLVSHAEELNVSDRPSVTRQWASAFMLLTPLCAWAYLIVWSLISRLSGLQQGCLQHFSLSHQLHHWRVQLSLSSLSAWLKQKTRMGKRKTWTGKRKNKKREKKEKSDNNLKSVSGIFNLLAPTHCV